VVDVDVDVDVADRVAAAEDDPSSCDGRSAAVVVVVVVVAKVVAIVAPATTSSDRDHGPVNPPSPLPTIRTTRCRPCRLVATAAAPPAVPREASYPTDAVSAANSNSRCRSRRPRGRPPAARIAEDDTTRGPRPGRGSCRCIRPSIRRDNHCRRRRDRSRRDRSRRSSVLATCPSTCRCRFGPC